jgi:hypothetical protein
MITLDKPSFIFTSEETQTNRKVSVLSINVNQYLGFVEKPQGFINSTINSDFGQLSELSMTMEDTEFRGEDVLAELHKIYLAKLQALNPEIKFTDTYNK